MKFQNLVGPRSISTSMGELVMNEVRTMIDRNGKIWFDN